MTRGWTSISEQWVNQERIDELEALAADDALQLRVDAYLALNFDKEFFGDWYEIAQARPGRRPPPRPGAEDPPGQWLGQRSSTGSRRTSPRRSVGRTRPAGRSRSTAMSSAAMELVLDAFEAALGPTGPNPLHHRIEHAVQVTDEQLARMVAMDLATVIHLDGASDWMMYDGLPGRVRPRRPARRHRGAGRPLARLRGRGAACRLGNRRAVDLSGLRARRSWSS